MAFSCLVGVMTVASQASAGLWDDALIRGLVAAVAVLLVMMAGDVAMAWRIVRTRNSVARDGSEAIGSPARIGGLSESSTRQHPGGSAEQSVVMW